MRRNFIEVVIDTSSALMKNMIYSINSFTFHIIKYYEAVKMNEQL